MQAKLLKSLHPGMTLAQVKRLFPIGTVISSTPEWCGGDSHLGNYFYLHGSISGSLSFLDHKRDFGEGQKYHPTDPINDLRLTTPVLPTSKRAGYLYIQCLSKILGKPRDEKWEKEQLAWWVVWNLAQKCYVAYSNDTHENQLEWSTGLSLIWFTSDSVPGSE